MNLNEFNPASSWFGEAAARPAVKDDTAPRAANRPMQCGRAVQYDPWNRWKPWQRWTRAGIKLATIALLCFAISSRAHADATLLLEEPYSYDGALAGTGHAAIYLDHVCAVSPVELRACAPGETGVVISRYKEVAGYDWIAIPLIPYLYAVDRPEDAPLFADARLVAFLRDQYRRKHLESLAADNPNGEAPRGDWYELIGASYDRMIYGFAIETTAEQDAELIARLNSRRNHKRFSLLKSNCADFAREVIDFYYPHAVHRSVIGDLGVTTPKQIAKMLSRYSGRHPELGGSSFVIPQVPGTIRRSKPVHGVLESAISAKKYMLPVLVLHPYISGSLLAAYFGRPRFDPGRHAPVIDARWQIDTPVTTADRRSYQNQLDELRQSVSPADPGREDTWPRLQAMAEPELDAFGTPVIQVHRGSTVEQVGMARANVLETPGSPQLAVKLLEARIQLELRPGIARKTANSDVASDLSLLRQVISMTPEKKVADTAPSVNPNSSQTGTPGEP